MYGIGEIRKMNAAVADLPQTKREVDFRVQRDQLGQVLRKLLALPRGAADTPEHTAARKVLADIYGK